MNEKEFESEAWLAVKIVVPNFVGSRTHSDFRNIFATGRMIREYQVRRTVNMMADYCWSMKREILDATPTKITPKLNIMEKFKTDYSKGL